MSWKAKVNSLLLVIDVGAGTSDFSMFRVTFDPATEESSSREIKGSKRAILEAGNHLDKLLTEYILMKAEVTSDDPRNRRIRGALILEIRGFKEALFRQGDVVVPLLGGEKSVDVELNEFLQLEPVQRFSQALHETMIEILKTIDPAWLRSAPFNGIGIVLTGGGAELPMVQELAMGNTLVQGTQLTIKKTPRFPAWLEEEHYGLEEEYPRIAVSLGGARQQYITNFGSSDTTGERYATVTLGGYYMKGN
ncbi:MAG: hypothetical protein V7707_05740 [Motiliproteus sp.]